MSIETKTTGVLIDELITVSQKLWHAQETICSSKVPEKIAAAAQNAQSLNVRRTSLIQAIDRALGNDHSITSKTYE